MGSGLETCRSSVGEGDWAGEGEGANKFTVDGLTDAAATAHGSHGTHGVGEGLGSVGIATMNSVKWESRDNSQRLPPITYGWVWTPGNDHHT